MAGQQLVLVEVVVSDLFVQNAFIVRREGREDCLILDPGFDADRIMAFLDARKLVPAAILNTHGHADHIAGNGPLKERWPQCPLVIGRGDAPKLTDARQNLSGAFGFAVTSPPADRLVADGDRLELAGLELQVLETPGHSAGHVVYLCKTGSPWQLFGGDMLFEGSVGRTDFPDGNPQQLAQSIRNKLYTLPEDTVVHAGHGEATTIGREKRFNPFVRA